MTNYLDHLQVLSSPPTWKRKQAYFAYNFTKYLVGFTPTSRVLEIGPGRGELVEWCSTHFTPHIDIADTDFDVLAYVSHTQKVEKTYQIGKRIGLPKNRYQAVFLVQVLEHVPPATYTSFLREIFDSLQPGGKLLLVVPNANNPFCSVERYGDIQHWNAFTSASLADLLRQLPNAKTQIVGYNIPPHTPLNILRIILQKILHAILLALMLVNGGSVYRPFTPNLLAVVTKP